MGEVEGLRQAAVLRHSAASPRSTYRVEISQDGKTWATAKRHRDPAGSGAEMGVQLPDGEWQLRLVREVGDWRSRPAPSLRRRRGLEGWKVTSIKLTTPKEQYTSGKGSSYRDLRGSVVVTETYRDGSTRTSKTTPERVQFGAGRVGLADPGPYRRRPGGHGAAGQRKPARHGRVRQGRRRRGCGSPCRGRPELPGAPSPSRRSRRPPVAQWCSRARSSSGYPNGSWQPIEDGRAWGQEGSRASPGRQSLGRGTANAKGQFNATVPLESAVYRLVVEGQLHKNLEAGRGKATKTATVAKPVVTDAGTNRYSMHVDI